MPRMSRGAIRRTPEVEPPTNTRCRPTCGASTLGSRAHHSVLCLSGGSPRGSVLVLVVAAQPEDLLALLVAADRCAVQQAVVAHRRFETARGGQVGPVDGAVR